MKKFRLLAIATAIYFVPSAASAQEIVASFELPYRAEAKTAARAALQGAKLVEKLPKAHCKELGRREQLRLKPVTEGVESIVVKVERPDRIFYVTEGNITGKCVRR